MPKNIFITGASKGFGKLWAEAFLRRGDNVIATSRDTAGLKDLAEQYPKNFLGLELEITDREAVFEAVQKADAHFSGGIDVLINNAGYGLIGMVEEYTEHDAKTQFNTNFFGTLWTTQAVLPHFRARRSGHILQLSSVLGINTFASFGIYSATKYAVEGLSEALQQEVKEYGIHVTLVEPNAYATDFAASAVQTAPNPAYDAVRKELAESPGLSEAATGIPEATVEALFAVIDSENPPLHFFLGSVGLEYTKYNYASKFAEWESWNEISTKAHGK